MVLDSPLFLSKVECPVCGTINEFETIRVGAYSEGERMSDFCPSVIKWRNPKYQKYNPLLFFTATCTNCYYTREFNNKFKEWHKDNNFRAYRLKAVREKHLQDLAAETSFTKLVGTSLDHETYPDETAIMKLLLAAFDELLNEHPSNLDLGRFYLRIAWMFRYMNAGDKDQTESSDTGSGHLVDIERGITELITWQAGLGRNLDYLKNAVEAHFGVADENRQPGSAEQNLNSALEKLSQLEEATRQAIGSLEPLPKLIAREADESASAGQGGLFQAAGSFDEFISRILRIWDGVPRSEKEAVRLAVRYYIGAFENGREISRGNQSIQAAYLIAELSRLIRDHDTARQYFNTTIKMGQDYINEIRGDRTRTALARKILELALAQGKKNLAEAKG